MSAIAPEVLWAQRSSETEEDKNVIYLTIKVTDVENPVIELTPSHLKFSGSSSDKKYELDLDFYEDINAEKSKYSTTGNKIFFVLYKTTKQAEYWPRLTKLKVKLHYLHTDFDKWVDEDEQDEEDKAADEDLKDLNGMGGNMDFSSLMGGAGGMGGMPGMGGAGGAGGMPDLSSMMAGMGGAGGAGGMPDLSAMMAGMGGAGGMPDLASMLAKGQGDEESSGLEEEDDGEEEK